MEVAVAHQRRVVTGASALQRRPVAVQPRPAAQVLGRAGDGPDPAVAAGEQVIGGRDAARPVGRAHAGQVRVGEVGGIHRHQRDPFLPELGQLRGGQLRGDQDDAVGVVAGQRARPARRAGAAVADRRHRGAHAVAGAPVLDPAQDLHGPRAVQAVEHDVDQARAPAAARPWPVVVELPEQALHPGTGLGGHVGPPVDHL